MSKKALEKYVHYNWFALGYDADGQEHRLRGKARAYNRDVLESQIEWMMYFDYAVSSIFALEIAMITAREYNMLNDGPVHFYEGPAPSWLSDDVVLFTKKKADGITLIEGCEFTDSEGPTDKDLKRYEDYRQRYEEYWGNQNATPPAAPVLEFEDDSIVVKADTAFRKEESDLKIDIPTN